jgi:hypothetical protein
MLPAVNRLIRTTALLLLALWVPVTAHCKLEVLLHSSLLACSTQGSSAPHQDSDCDGDECSVVESGLYKIDDQPQLGFAPLAAPLVTWEWVGEFLPRLQAGPVSFGAAPPELPRTWQFSWRTALPPRAPSFLS